MFKNNETVDTLTARLFGLEMAVCALLRTHQNPERARAWLEHYLQMAQALAEASSMEEDALKKFLHLREELLSVLSRDRPDVPPEKNG